MWQCSNVCAATASTPTLIDASELSFDVLLTKSCSCASKNTGLQVIVAGWRKLYLWHVSLCSG